MRKDYKSEALNLSDIDMNPEKQFRAWFKEAVEGDVPEPNAFTLATVSEDGQPSARVVLFKGLDDGFIFYTNYNSHKGKNIAANPKVSACFFWQNLHRQVRIEGICEKLSAEKSDEYFNKRPIGSRIGAITSPQSEGLEMMWQANAAELGNQPNRPEYWGGYIIKPIKIEFWQGQRSRLHDRFLYTKHDKGAWKIERLAP